MESGLVSGEGDETSLLSKNNGVKSGFPAMQQAARTILENHRAKECDEICMPFKEIIRLIPEED